ncbi:MAG: FAD:protein FMN transferase, partial [Rhodothermales bacterium]
MSVRANFVVILPFLIAPVLVASMGACTRLGRLDLVAETGRASTVDVPAASAGLHRFEYTQVHMGVQARLVLYAGDTTEAERAARAAFDRIGELDGVMSDYRRDSELNRLVASARTKPVPVSDDLFRVLTVSQRIARESDGAFDVTVGPLVALWREARRRTALPSDDALREARRRSGYQLLQLDEQRSTATLGVNGMQIDLGGIAKGFAADEALDALRSHGVSRVLIEIGGDIVTGDPPPEASGWSVTVPLADRTFTLSNAAISTSGDTQQFVEIDGVRYSHVLD